MAMALAKIDNSLQISLICPPVPVLALTGTATRDRKCEIISTLGLLNPMVFNVIQTGKITLSPSQGF